MPALPAAGGPRPSDRAGRARLSRSPARAGTGRVVAASIALHAAVIAICLLHWRGLPAPAAESGPTVALVIQKSPVVGEAARGAAPSPAAPPAPAPAPPTEATPPAPTPAPEASSKTVPTPVSPGGTMPPPAPRRAVPPPRPAAAPPPPRPAPRPARPADTVRLGDPDSLLPDGASATGVGLASGNAVVPASPDATQRNAPPAYPLAAAERNEQGAVTVLIHVAPDGHAASVDITGSSGYRALDLAARAAVARWHFNPAKQDGIPIASTLPFRVVFSLDGRE